MSKFTAPNLSAPQFAMNPASRVFAADPAEIRSQPTLRRARAEQPIVILNRDWRPTVFVESVS